MFTLWVFKSYALCLGGSVYLPCFVGERRRKLLWDSADLSHPVDAVFVFLVCLLVITWLPGVTVQPQWGGSRPKARAAQAQGSDKVTPAALSEWTHVNKLTLCVDARSPLTTRVPQRA